MVLGRLGDEFQHDFCPPCASKMFARGSAVVEWSSGEPPIGGDGVTGSPGLFGGVPVQANWTWSAKTPDCNSTGESRVIVNLCPDVPSSTGMLCLLHTAETSLAAWPSGR